MKESITSEAEKAVNEIAQRHGLSRDSVLAMLSAVRLGGGAMAQFSIPELGGPGMWMRGGMTMVSNLHDSALTARVDALCNELAQQSLMPEFTASSAENQDGTTSAHWWPGELGVPSAFGGQNDIRYAIFPTAQRLTLRIDGVTKIFDTGEHHIGGVQQQQDDDSGSVTFTSQFGTLDLSTLPELPSRKLTETSITAPPDRHQAHPPSRPVPPTPTFDPTPGGSGKVATTIVAAIESLAGLHQRGILSDEEFTRKKTELLDRL